MCILNTLLYNEFTDLGEARGRVDRRALWQMGSIYGVGGKLLRALQSLYDDDNRMCVRVSSLSPRWCLGQGCVMSPWLFNIYTDGVVRELYTRAVGNGVNLVGMDG